MSIGDNIIADFIIGDHPEEESSFPGELGVPPVTCYLFEINGHYFGQTEVFFRDNLYLNKVIKESFSGVTLRTDMETKLMAQSEVSVEIEDVDQDVPIADLQNQDLIVYLLLEGTLVRTFRFYIGTEEALWSYGSIKIKATDALRKYIGGEYPPTKTIAAEFPALNVEIDPSYCIPYLVGPVEIPVMPGLYDGDNTYYYILREQSLDALVITQLAAPREVNKYETFSSSDYTFTTSVKSGKTVSCDVAKFLIHDSDGNGSFDANGVWLNTAGGLLPPVVQYLGAGSRLPGTFLYNFLIDIGISADLINDNTFNIVNNDLKYLFAGWPGYWRHGAFRKQAAEPLLSHFLSCGDCFLSFGDKITCQVFSATPIETFNISNISKLSYSSSFIETEVFDGGVVASSRSFFYQDILPEQITVSINNSDVQPTITNPSSEVFMYDVGQSNTPNYELPNLFGQLYFQKKHGVKYGASFTVPLEDLITRETINPGHVVLIAGTSEGDSVYGEEQTVLINEITFTPDFEVDISGKVYDYLNDVTDADPATLSMDEAAGSDVEVRMYTVTAKGDRDSAAQFDGQVLHVLDLTDDQTGGRLNVAGHDAFQAYLVDNQPDVTVGSAQDVEFDGNTNDHTGAFDTDTYTYTANGDGWRQLNVTLWFDDVDSGTTEALISLVTSNETFYYHKDISDVGSVSFSVLAYMDNGDTAKVQIELTGGSSTVDIWAGSSWFSGFFVND